MRTISQRSKPIKVEGPVTLVPQDKYEALMETLEILSSHKLLSRIEAALKNIQKGRFFSHQEVFRRP